MRRTPNRGEGIVTYIALVNKSGKITLISEEFSPCIGISSDFMIRNPGSEEPLGSVVFKLAADGTRLATDAPSQINNHGIFVFIRHSDSPV